MNGNRQAHNAHGAVSDSAGIAVSSTTCRDASFTTASNATTVIDATASSPATIHSSYSPSPNRSDSSDEVDLIPRQRSNASARFTRYRDVRWNMENESDVGVGGPTATDPRRSEWVAGRDDRGEPREGDQLDRVAGLFSEVDEKPVETAAKSSVEMSMSKELIQVWHVHFAFELPFWHSFSGLSREISSTSIHEWHGTVVVVHPMNRFPT